MATPPDETLVAALARQEPVESAPGRAPGRSYRRRAAALARLLLMFLPGLLTAYLGFHAGGFFAGGPAAVAVILALALVLQVTLADHPAAGLGWLVLVAVAALTGFALLVLISGSWSDSPARALVEFDRALAYLLALLLFGSLVPTFRRISLLLWGFAAAATLVSLVGLGSRLLPGLLPTNPNIANARLSYPVTYWNALGLLVSLAIVACFHLSTSERQPRVARVLGAAAVPALAVTLYFTLSRGAIAAGIVGVVAYVVLARPRALVPGLLATAPATTLAVVVAYGADKLVSDHPTAPAAGPQAHRVALVTGLALAAAALVRALLLPLDARLTRVEMSSRGRRALAGLAALVLIGALATAVATGVPAQVEHQYHRFVKGGHIKSRGNARRRLTDPGNNGRLDIWRVALEGYRAERLRGQGAGTYQILWARHRPTQFEVLDGHSLYLESLDELGLLGIALLAVVLLCLLVGVARRIRGADRALYAAVFAMTLAWLLHAGIDWDWEMPVVCLWVFALGGACLARPPDVRRLARGPGRLTRVVVALGCLVLAVTPALIYLSQRDLDRGVHSFKRGDCPAAVDAALDSNAVLAVRPEPFEILAYCDVRLGRPALARAAMQQAVDRDPHNWQLRYGFALVRGATGVDPRSEARMALRLNPLDERTKDAVERFRTTDPRKWRRRALSARLPVQ